MKERINICKHFIKHKKYVVWAKLACGYQVRGRNSDDKTHLLWFVWFIAEVCGKYFNYFKIVNPRKNGLLTSAAIIADRKSPYTDALLALSTLLAIDTPKYTDVFGGKGNTLKKLNEDLADYCKGLEFDNKVEKEHLTSYYNRNSTVNDLRMGGIDVISIDLRCRFQSGSSN